MSYSNPWTCMYNFGVMDFGAAVGATTHQIAGPAGKKGRLIEVGVTLTEATVFATTLGFVRVGIIGDLDAYAELGIATAQAINTTFNSGDDTDALLEEDIPADGCIQVTLIEGTGAGLTGQGQPYVIIDWY